MPTHIPRIAWLLSIGLLAASCGRSQPNGERSQPKEQHVELSTTTFDLDALLEISADPRRYPSDLSGSVVWPEGEPRTAATVAEAIKRIVGSEADWSRSGSKIEVTGSTIAVTASDSVLAQAGRLILLLDLFRHQRVPAGWVPTK